MGVTAIAIVFSPLGKRSGAHFNPAVTLTFWRLGKIRGWDALFYVLAQCFGAVAGVVAFEVLAVPALSPIRASTMSPRYRGRRASGGPSSPRC